MKSTWNLVRSLSILISVSIAPSLHGQAKSSFSLPKFYGTYAVSNGKTIGLDSDTNYPNKAVVKLGVRNNAQSVCRNGAPVAQSPRDVELPVFSPDVNFVVFLQASGPVSPMTVAQDMQLSTVGYVRNVEIGNCPNAGMAKRGTENGWDQIIQQVQLRVGPVPGQQEMVVSVPSSPLAPGIYSLSFDPVSGGFKRTFLFAVQPVAEAANSRCVDLSLQYNVFMFNNGGEMDVNAVPCGSRAGVSNGGLNGAPATPVSNSASSGATNNSGAILPTSAIGAATWIDAETGLMWTGSDNNADLTFDQAVDYCKNLKLGGYSNWRLPEIEELKGISDPSANVPVNRPDVAALHIPGQPAPAHIKGDITISGGEMSNTGKPPAQLETFDFGVLKVDRLKSDKRHRQIRALCVRDSK